VTKYASYIARTLLCVVKPVFNEVNMLQFESLERKCICSK